MLLSMPLDGYSDESGEDDSWLIQRFSPSSQPLRPGEDITRKAVEDIRSQIALDDARITTVLAEHMESRIEDLMSTVDFIVDNLPAPDREAALKMSQHYSDYQRGDAAATQAELKDYKPKYDLAYVEGIRQSIPSISSAPERVEAFSRFADLEAALEPVETIIDAMDRDLDESIQLQIDIMRGK
jgi:hypothetical protein